MKGKFLTVHGTMTVDGTLDLDASLTTHVNSIIKAVDNDTAVTLAFTADSQYDNGQLDESAYPAIVFHYKSGATTVSDFETTVAASHHLAVVTPGTAGNIFLVGDDDFAATSVFSGTLNVDTDSATIDLTGMINVSIYVNQIVDNGNATLKLEKTIDGINWASLTTDKSQADFPAGNNTAFVVSLSDSNGMPLLVKQVRMTLSGHSGTGEYTISAAGLQMEGYR